MLFLTMIMLVMLFIAITATGYLINTANRSELREMGVIIE